MFKRGVKGSLDLKEGFKRSKKINLGLREVRCSFLRWFRGLLDLKDMSKDLSKWEKVCFKWKRGLKGERRSYEGLLDLKDVRDGFV